MSLVKRDIVRDAKPTCSGIITPIALMLRAIPKKDHFEWTGQKVWCVLVEEVEHSNGSQKLEGECNVEDSRKEPRQDYDPEGRWKVEG